MGEEIVNVFDALNFIKGKIKKEEREYMDKEDYGRLRKCNEAAKCVHKIEDIFNLLYDDDFCIIL